MEPDAKATCPLDAKPDFKFDSTPANDSDSGNDTDDMQIPVHSVTTRVNNVPASDTIDEVIEIQVDMFVSVSPTKRALVPSVSLTPPHLAASTNGCGSSQLLSAGLGRQPRPALGRMGVSHTSPISTFKKKIVLKTPLSSTVSGLMAQLNSTSDTLSTRHQPMFNGKQLDEGRTLRSYDIRHKDTITISLGVNDSHSVTQYGGNAAKTNRSSISPAKLWLLSALSLATVMASPIQAAKPANTSESVSYSKHVAVIGAGFSGLTAACELRRLGYDVTVFEKHDQVGGRARTFTSPEGFSFDMGPSWYWMPGIFDHIFARYGRTVEEFYNITLLDPAYRIELPNNRTVDVPGTYEGLVEFAKAETIRDGHSNSDEVELSMELFFSEAKEKFDQGVYNFIWKPMVSVTELFDIELIRAGLELDMFSGFSAHLAKYTSNKLMHLILKWPVIFIGADPQDAASMYSLMTFAGHAQGTWYPDGGLSAPGDALASIARDLGVQFRLNSDVTEFVFSGRNPDTLTAICVKGDSCTPVDAVVASGDYHHIEQHLLPQRLRQYDTSFWDRQIMSPSCLLYYIGFNTSLPGVLHHTFFFEEDIDDHLRSVFDSEPVDGYYPTPTFYASATSKTDRMTLPPDLRNQNGETVFILVPVHPKLNGSDTNVVREELLIQILDRIETRISKHCTTSSNSSVCRGVHLNDSIIYQRSYGPSDFESDHYAFRGNAFGLANTLTQSLVLKPSIESKVANMVFAGHLTSPGPGVPPSLVSGVVAALVLNSKLDKDVTQSVVMSSLVEACHTFSESSIGLVLCWLFIAAFTIAWILVPIIEWLAAVAFHLIVPPARKSPFSTSSSPWEILTRSRSYLKSIELMYRHGRTYFCAATLMEPRCFVDTSAMYAIFRVSDDFVDNDDERLRADEVDGSTGQIAPGKFALGASERGQKLNVFMKDFWECWWIANGKGPDGKSVGLESRMTIEDVYRKHPVLPAVIESGVICGYTDDLFIRFFRAMKSDTTTETKLGKDELNLLFKQNKNIPKVDACDYVYVGKACRSKEEMLDYMDGSAAVIGDFMLPLLVPIPEADGAPETTKRRLHAMNIREKALSHARSLGNAFQLTNFIRDIHEDTFIARQYIPTDRCAAHGICGKPREVVTKPGGEGESSNIKQKCFVGFPLTFSDHTDFKGEKGIYEYPGFVPLIEEMLNLAEMYYTDSDIGTEMLPGRTRGVIKVARKAYSAIHDKIREGDYKIYDKRFKVPLRGKLAAAASALTQYQAMRILSVEVLMLAFTALAGVMRGICSFFNRYQKPVLLLVFLVALCEPVSTSSATFAGVLSYPSITWRTIARSLSIDEWILYSTRDSSDGLMRLSGIGELINCSYARFHGVFTIPLAIVSWAASFQRGSVSSSYQHQFLLATSFWTFVLCLVATVYTIPWDNYLLKTGSWWYGPDRVYQDLMVWHIPIEEVAFFSIQTVAVSALWFLWFCPTSGGKSIEHSVMVPPTNLPLKDVQMMLKLRRQGYFVLAGLQLLGLLLLSNGNEYLNFTSNTLISNNSEGILGQCGTYAGLIISWSIPVLALQWAVGAEALIDNSRCIMEVVGFAGVYLGAADRWAIRHGIWTISSDKTIPEWISTFILGKDLPLEEQLFFIVTTAMCVCGLTLAVIVSLDYWNNKSDSFYQALLRLHDWGCSASISAASSKPEILTTKASVQTKVSVGRDPIIDSCYRASLYCAPLAAVAHFPVEFAQIIGRIGLKTSSVVSLVRTLQSIRGIYLLISFGVIILCLRQADRNGFALKVASIIGANMIFSFIPPRHALIVAVLIGGADQMRHSRRAMKSVFPIIGLLVIGGTMSVRGQEVLAGGMISSAVRLAYTALFTVTMEYVARYGHLFLWHSESLWWLHGTHHHQAPKYGEGPKFSTDNSYTAHTLELNDLFPLFFASICISLLYYGAHYPTYLAKDCWSGIALGTTMYGLSYFIGHDIVAHERMGKSVARYLRNTFPTIDKCVEVHQKYHHKLKDQDGDPYGPPYGFWFGPDEVDHFKKTGEAYLPMKTTVKRTLQVGMSVAVSATIYAVGEWVYTIGIAYTNA